MEKELLIKALRYCADKDKICTEQTNCGYYGKAFFCQDELMLDAADALEAAEQRIADLEAQLPKEGEWQGMWGEDDWYEAQAKDAMKDDIEIVNKQPTVDAVPVVRCRECKWWTSPIPIEMKEKGYGYCGALCTNTHENEYCAWGKRRFVE